MAGAHDELTRKTWLFGPAIADGGAAGQQALPNPPPGQRRLFCDGSLEPSASAAPMILGELDRDLVEKGIAVRNGFDFRMGKHAEINFPRWIGASREPAWRVRNLRS